MPQDVDGQGIACVHAAVLARDETRREEQQTTAVVVVEGVVEGGDSLSQRTGKEGILTLTGIESGPKLSKAARVGGLYLHAWNKVYGRRVGNPTIERQITDRVGARLRDGIEPELIMAAPILAAAMERWNYVDRNPTVLLRDGSTAKTREGNTYAATDFLGEIAAALDTITLSDRLARAARALHPEAEPWLRAKGVKFEEPPPPPATAEEQAVIDAARDAAAETERAKIQAARVQAASARAAAEVRTAELVDSHEKRRRKV